MEMLSILIVDDEIITRKGLKSYVNWEKLQIGTIYDTGNPSEAIEMARQYKPDILLSDVSMPGMNGIEMCLAIREIHRACQIIFLSGYSDKEYLKGAISLEAVDYVEKPVDIEELENALSRAVEKQQRSRRGREKLRNLMTENYSLMERHLVDRLSVPHVRLEELKPEFSKMKIDWSGMREFAVVLFKFHFADPGSNGNLVREIERAFEGISYIHSRKESYYLIFICAFADQGTTAMAESLRAHLRHQKQVAYYCAVGEPARSMERIYESYQSAVIKMQQIYFWSQRQFALIGKPKERGLIFDESIFADFTNGLKQYKQDVVERAIENLYHSMQRQQEVMVSSVKGIYFRFLEALYKKAEFSVGRTDVSGAGIEGLIWEKLHEADTLKLCHRYLLNETAEYFKNVGKLAESNQAIIMIISYIQSNFSNTDLCLDNIAQNVYLSQNYLSSLFKKKMGKTISQYIVDVRIDHAKALLSNRSYKLYDVAVQVGYKDANYFAKIFKKTLGITPSEYREKYNR